MKLSNPFTFLPLSVTLITTAVYLAILTPLIVVHETVPPAPTNATAHRGLNLTEAWLDLAELSNGYHPFNSRRNDEVRDWLLRRIEGILDINGALSRLEDLGDDMEVGDSPVHGELRARTKSPPVTVFNDIVSNYTSTALATIGVDGRRLGISTYFEGSNIIVYIRGTEDEEGEWWEEPIVKGETHGKGGVMVNAHFDSVSTGYGATDDGMGVITALQLIRYFTTAGNTPKKGVVILLNNGEEDGLYGAKAFLSHPIASFVHSFLNLEGAGAGGRATLFRSTDAEITHAYGRARHPFGTVVSADGFEQGVIRSQTDYVVFQAEGYRGLDVAFWEPRARYHTDQDDAKHASIDSLWHMLSASVETTRYLSADTSSKFDGPRGDGSSSKVKNGRGSDGVWFDLFGQSFAVFRLHSLFAWSVTILVVSPLVLILVTVFLVRSNKYYLFSRSIKSVGSEDEPTPLDGWRGVFRFPVAFIVSAALTVGAQFLIRKFNPLIIYSSPYSVWAMSISLFFAAFWFLMAGANFVRPSALHRGYALLWLFVIGWGVLVATTVFENRYKVSGGYLFVFYQSAIFLATLVSLLELFALPTKALIAEGSHDEQEVRQGLEAVPHSDAIIAPTDEVEDEGADASETTPLVGGEHGNSRTFGTTFANRYRQGIAETGDLIDESPEVYHAFGDEQKWSAKLPTWTWLLQFLILGPFILIIVGQVGLVVVTATNQTGTDGGPLLLPYLAIAFFSVLLVLPLGPFMHRITHHVPTFLFLVFIGTLIYNLTAFPFSANNRYKAYFQQTVDLDTGLNTVTLAGIEEYIRDIISHIPSASGQTISCTPNPNIRSGLSFCTYRGPAPRVVRGVPDGVPPEKGYHGWLSLNATRSSDKSARFHIKGRETKACAIRWDDPFSAFHVHGAAPGGADVPPSGSDQIKLWHRDWDREWVVDAEWAEGEGRSGRAVCAWSDHNKLGLVPALDEVQRFMPAWTSAVKLAEGLVEGSKRFVV